MVGEYTELSCPFCDKGRISALYIAGAWSVKSSGRSSLGSGKSVTKSKDMWLVKTGCSVCGKSREEIEREMKIRHMI